MLWVYECEGCGHKDRYPEDDGCNVFCRECGKELGSFECHEQEAKWFVVAVYLIDHAYGGPEEGGWYYPVGYPITSATPLLRTFRKEKDAYAYQDRLQRALDATWNYGRRDIGSVLSEGVYVAKCLEEEMPHPYPSTRPRYC